MYQIRHTFLLRVAQHFKSSLHINDLKNTNGSLLLNSNYQYSLYQPYTYCKSILANILPSSLILTYQKWISTPITFQPLYTYQTNLLPTNILESLFYINRDELHSNDRWKEDNSEELRQQYNQQQRELKKQYRDSQDNNEHDEDDGSNNTKDTAIFWIQVISCIAFTSVLVGILRKSSKKQEENILDQLDKNEIEEFTISSTGADCTSFQEAKNISLISLIGAIGYTNLCLQESIDALNSLRSRFAKFEASTGDDESDFEVSNVERIIMAEYERAIADLQSRLDAQHRTFLWSLEHCLSEIAQLNSSFGSNPVPKEVLDRRQKELSFLTKHISSLLWRPRTTSEATSLSQLTESIDGSGLFGATNSKSAVNIHKPESFDKLIVDKYNALISEVCDLAKKYTRYENDDIYTLLMTAYTSQQ